MQTYLPAKKSTVQEISRLCLKPEDIVPTSSYANQSLH